MSDLSNNKRIAKNTIYLYIRMFVTLIVALYTTRVVLRVLGESDYGLYNVTAGILAMFAMFNGALTVGTQRFLNFAMGEQDFEKLKRTFSIAFGIHVFIAVLCLFVGETLGLWFVLTQLNIPEGREVAAFWVFQFSLIAFLISLIQLPFQSCIIAHEEMNIYAIMSIYEVIMNLLAVFLIQCIDVDKLILYALLILIIRVSIALVYNIYCRRKFSECSFRIVRDKALTKEMLAYSGWNLLGGTMSPITNQGVNILLNIFCGTVVNAARGISVSVNAHLVAFVNNFQMAANPQIVKLYAEKQLDKFFHLIINNGRIASYLFLFVAVPFYIEVEFVLKLWLGTFPEYTPVFIQIILIQSYFAVLNKPINMSVHATGEIKYLNIANACCVLIVLPLSYVALKIGYSPTSVYWINVGFYVSDNICNLYFSHKYTRLPLKKFLTDVYLNSILGGAVMFVVPYLVSRQMPIGWHRFFTVGLVSVFISIIVIYFWGLTPGMKNLLLDTLRIKKRQK